MGGRFRVLPFSARRLSLYGRRQTAGRLLVRADTGRSLPSLRRSHEFRRYKHDRAARTPVSERGLVPRENTAFLGAARDSGNERWEVA